MKRLREAKDTRCTATVRYFTARVGGQYLATEVENEHSTEGFDFQVGNTCNYL